MDYMSTLEGLEGFSNALARCYEHPLVSLTIFYHFVWVRRFWELQMAVNKAPCSLLVNY